MPRRLVRWPSRPGTSGRPCERSSPWPMPARAVARPVRSGRFSTRPWPERRRSATTRAERWRSGLGWALGLLAFTRFHSGHPEEAETMAEQVFSGAEEAGNRWAVGMGLVLTASTRLWTGRAKSAVERAREALETFEAIGDDYGRVQARVPLGRALVTSGHVDEGFEVLEEAGALAPPPRPPGVVALFAPRLLRP